jgi:hypothetical protein
MNIPSTVPEIEHQVTHELDVAVLDIDCGTQPAYVLGDVVAKDDASHRRLSCPALSHQEHLALLLALCRIHLAGDMMYRVRLSHDVASLILVVAQMVHISAAKRTGRLGRGTGGSLPEDVRCRRRGVEVGVEDGGRG